MTRTYALHVSRDASPGEPEALDRAEIVRDGFSWGAFLFTAFWFFWHRLWLAGLAVLIGFLAFGFLLRGLGVPPWAGWLSGLLLSLLTGLEAASLRGWTLSRRGRPAALVVSAQDADEAETKLFTGFLAAERGGIGPQREPLWTAGQRRPDPVIGLFPDAEGSR